MCADCHYSVDDELNRKFGWGGRIRTFTVLINSEVSYQLDHAPILFHLNMQARTYCTRVTAGSSADRPNPGRWRSLALASLNEFIF
jgi:hypothetical protein